ncbi:MAG: LuxR C-terminal-related transcriptional regulator [Chthoniobacteraceae bacterium]
MDFQRTDGQAASMADGQMTLEQIDEKVLHETFRTLTRAECRVLQWIVHGKTDGEIAIIVGCAWRTVTTHVSRILSKLEVESRHAATILVIRVVICGEPFSG